MTIISVTILYAIWRFRVFIYSPLAQPENWVTQNSLEKTKLTDNQSVYLETALTFASKSLLSLAPNSGSSHRR